MSAIKIYMFYKINNLSNENVRIKAFKFFVE